MGLYLNKITGNRVLPVKGKLRVLISAGEVSQQLDRAPTQWMPNLVCVIENTFFDAALYVEDKLEFERIMRAPDARRKSWIIVPNASELAE